METSQKKEHSSPFKREDRNMISLIIRLKSFAQMGQALSQVKKLLKALDLKKRPAKMLHKYRFSLSVTAF